MPKSKLPKSILPDPWTKPPAPEHRGKNAIAKGGAIPDGGLGHKGQSNPPTGSTVGRPGNYPPHQAKRRA